MMKSKIHDYLVDHPGLISYVAMVTFAEFMVIVF